MWCGLGIRDDVCDCVYLISSGGALIEIHISHEVVTFSEISSFPANTHNVCCSSFRYASEKPAWIFTMKCVVVDSHHAWTYWTMIYI